MPERLKDEIAIWEYQMDGSKADLERSPYGVRYPDMVEAVGADGRHKGSMRTFMGFAGPSVHKLDIPDGLFAAPTGLEDILLAKYVSIQKGLTNHSLRGIVYLCADNSYVPATHRIVFVYYDTELETSGVQVLETFGQWRGGAEWYEPQTLEEYDFSYQGQYIYFTAVCTFPDPATSMSPSGETRMPFNRAYYWNFIVGPDDQDFGTALNIPFQRSMGLFFGGFSAFEKSREAGSNLVAGLGLGYTSSPPPIKGDSVYGIGVQLHSRKHRLRSPFIQAPPYQTATGSLGQVALGYRLEKVRSGISFGYNFDNLQYYWGMPHADGVSVYRTPGQPTTTVPTADEFRDLGLFYREKVYNPIAGTGFQSTDIMQVINSTNIDLLPLGQANVNGAPKAGPTDNALAAYAEEYDPILDEFGEMPITKRLICTDGLTIIATNAFQKDDPDTKWSEEQVRGDDIRWSSLGTEEPENFPAGNSSQILEGGEKVLGFYKVGDYVAAVTTGNVYRLQRAGGRLVITNVLSGMGGVSRWGAVGIGNTLILLTSSGLEAIDMASRSHEPLSSVSWKLTDNGEWASTLANVHVAYDAQAACIILLNTALEETVLLWKTTGNVTTLEKTPFSFVVSGPDPADNGTVRAYFIRPTGHVSCIDAERSCEKRSMVDTAVGGSNNKLNGTSTGGGSDYIDDTGGTAWPVNSKRVGFYVYIHSGANAGQWRKITQQGGDPSTRLRVTTAFVSPIVAGVRYSIGPVPIRWVWPQLVGTTGVTPFARKVTQSMGAALVNTAGEVTINDVNSAVTMGIQKRLASQASGSVTIDEAPDQMHVAVKAHGNQLFPYLECNGSNIDFELQTLQVRGIISGSEAESRRS